MTAEKLEQKTSNSLDVEEDPVIVESDAHNDSNNSISHNPINSSTVDQSNTNTNNLQDSTTNDRDASCSVQVAVRIRPLLAKEADTDICVVSQNDNKAIQIGGSSGPRFTFDHVFSTTCSQTDVYEAPAVSSLVQSCLQGYNATILAYGQTGSGKTFTIMGSSTNDPASMGVIPRAVHDLFAHLNSQTSSVRLQFLEVYGEEINDLLTSANGAKLTIRETGTADGDPEVLGATQKVVGNAKEALLAVTHGMLRRVTGATAMNESSSRSHALLTLLIEQQDTLHSTSTNTLNNDESIDDAPVVQVKRSKFNFVDLAGSERQKRTLAQGKRLKEGIDINVGLLVLGNVISALGDPKKKATFVPYRDSKLTRLLKGSLGGNHKTLMIACVSPSSDNMDESLNCLRYANRAKNIQNNAVVNVDASSRLLQELHEQVQVLAADVLRALDGNAVQTSRHELTLLASGEISTVASSKQPASLTNGSLQGEQQNHAPTNLISEQKRKETQLDLDRCKQQLRETRAHHDSAEEQLYIVKAENELLKLQLSVLSKSGGNENKTNEQNAFLQKAKDYEAELGQLREELRVAESKYSNMLWMADDQDTRAIANAKEALDKEKERLLNMQSLATSQDDLTQAESPAVLVDRDENDEEAHLDGLTSKYLNDSFDQFGDGLDTQEVMHGNVENRTTTLLTEPTQDRIHADLSELSRSIAVKEDLIEQLRASQEKFAVHIFCCT
jgi:hypothetical protein